MEKIVIKIKGNNATQLTIMLGAIFKIILKVVLLKMGIIALI